jgi:uncharacterized SAM-binding protein YcdF (DUF218 family)
MEIFFLLKKLVSAVVLPPCGPLALSVAGLIVIKRKPRLGRGLAWTGLTVLFLLAWSPVSMLLTRAIEIAEPLDLSRAGDAQAIVVLGGGLRRRAAEYGGDTLGTLSLERVRYGAWVARRTGLPVLVTGGVVFAGRPEAEVMSEALEAEFGVPVRWKEGRSRDTHQNAVFSAKLLKEAGVEKIVLVAHAVDMRRARREFARAGFEVIPAPTRISEGWRLDHPLQLLPNAGALEGSYLATYEILGNLASWLGLLGTS